MESEPGKGSTFWFTVRLEKEAADATSPEGGRRDLSGLRVLAVDDNATNRRIPDHQLGAWQMQPGSAASGQEALGRLQPQPKLANRITWRYTEILHREANIHSDFTVGPKSTLRTELSESLWRNFGRCSKCSKLNGFILYSPDVAS